MNNLPIPITTSKIGEESLRVTDARVLHAYLEVGKKFSDWIKDRIDAYGFVKNVDYIVFPNSGKNPQGEANHKFMKNPFGGRPAKEYHISMDMAKEIAMVERNEKGREARRYFIDCERKYREAQPRIKEKPALRLVTEESYLEIVAQKEELCSKYIALLEENAYQVKKPRRTHRPITPEDTAEIITLFAQGLSQKEIALQVGRSSATVSTTVRNHVAKGGAA